MIIKVKAKPGAKEEKIEEKNGWIIVYVKSRAEKGKANRDILRLLERHYGKTVRIVSGRNSRTKIIEIT